MLLPPQPAADFFQRWLELPPLSPSFDAFADFRLRFRRRSPRFADDALRFSRPPHYFAAAALRRR